MSEQKFEECSLRDATHVEMGGKVHKLESDKIELEYNDDECIGLGLIKENAFIPKELFPTLGIKPLFEHKPKPIEFEAVFGKYDSKWYPMYGLDDITYQNSKKARFRCVEILEDEK